MFIGSLNLDPMAVYNNTEIGVVITQMEISNEMGEWFDQNIDKIAFRLDKYGIVHSTVGRVSFAKEKLAENADELMSTLIRMKPSSAKGTYIKSVAVASTMSPGIKIDPKSFI